MELLYQYEEYLSNYSKTTKETYLICVEMYLRYLKETKGNITPITICNVSRGDIYNYIAYMDNLKRNTKAVRLYAIKNFYAFINKNIAAFLFEDIKLYNLNNKMPVCLTSSQCEQLINYYKGKRNQLIIYLLLTTGIRVSECANLKIEDINLKEKFFRCYCKGGITRNVFMNEKLKKMLCDYIKEKEGYLFKIKKHDIQYIVKKALKKLGFNGSAHTLRHTAATIIYQNTRDILLVKEFLGHKTVISTQIYAHMNSELIKKAVESNPLANYEVGGQNES